MQKASKELHFTVGLFVIITTFCLILFSFWIAGTSTQNLYKKYAIYFKESVYGVNVGTEVAYKGFQVGKVSKISLNPNDPEHIRVVIEIESNTPIKEDTEVTLKPKGITGLTFIEIIGGSKESPTLRRDKTSRKDKYPIIKAADSLIGKVIVGIPEIIDKLQGVTDRISQLFNNKNLENIENSLANIEQITHSLEEATSDGQIAVTVDEIQKTAEAFSRTALELEKFIVENKKTLANFSDVALIEITNTLRSTKKAADEIESLAESLKDDPSQIIFSPNEKGYRIPK